ncbi:MAG: D-aminoacyl-tRNA deacylase [Bacilli bacterium]|nr:D-aminoacyl-tRNA deacylase [Acholeplasmataceae bacterium]MDY2903072.1 D-aminoacyl-tRNA deacylase [Bacilli bacterium]
MRVIVQRVKRAKCIINKKIVGEIKEGYMLLVGFTHSDTKMVVDKMVKKIVNLRIFEDENGKMNLNINQVNGEVLSISQFTLYGNTNDGNRPSFVNAMKPEEATLLYDYFNNELNTFVTTKTGVFGADMDIDFVNHGPSTFLLEF